MDFNFEELYNSYSKEELFEILTNPEDYQENAVEVAKRIAKNKGWLSEINHELKQQANEEELLYKKQEIIKAIIADQCFLEIIGYYILEADSLLAENNIDHYFVEKSNPKSPGRFYYFFKKDFERVKQLLSHDY